MLCSELCGDVCDLAEYETYLQMTDALCVNDCKSLADALPQQARRLWTDASELSLA